MQVISCLNFGRGGADSSRFICPSEIFYCDPPLLVHWVVRWGRDDIPGTRRSPLMETASWLCSPSSFEFILFCRYFLLFVYITDPTVCMLCGLDTNMRFSIMDTFTTSFFYYNQGYTLYFIHIGIRSTGYPIYKIIFSELRNVTKIEPLRVKILKLWCVRWDEMRIPVAELLLIMLMLM